MRGSARTETGEVRINSSKLRKEHIGIWKTVAFSFKNKKNISGNTQLILVAFDKVLRSETICQ